MMMDAPGMAAVGTREAGTVGILPLGRPTFDVPYAEERLGEMLAALDAAGAKLAGSRSLLFGAAATRDAISDLQGSGIDRVLILQVTFTDASMTVEIANAFDLPLAIWAVPEPRLGGRLRLNSFCGLNLASHALGLNGRRYGTLYADPLSPEIGAALTELLAGDRIATPVPVQAARPGVNGGSAAVAAVRGSRIARIGRHPDGFDTCAYDKGKLAALADVSVDELELSALFDRAKAASGGTVAAVRGQAESLLAGLDEVDQPQLDRSLRLKVALDELRQEGGYDAFAIRCWPETFAEYGGAVCGPVSMAGEARVPCACEADVYGALTTLLLQKVADAPAFLADLVDLDVEDDSGVVWHCGQAPVSMADAGFRPRATIHTNRKMPLLFEFPLKSGRVTFFRISQARGEPMAVIGGGEMLKRPMAFTGTSGVVRFDSGSRRVLETVIGSALEHHMALAYGDHRDTLEAAAAELKLPGLRL
jgi:L-fucose isomerase-like protein